MFKFKNIIILVFLLFVSCSYNRIKRIENLCLDNRKYILDNYGMLIDVYCMNRSYLFSEQSIDVKDEAIKKLSFVHVKYEYYYDVLKITQKEYDDMYKYNWAIVLDINKENNIAKIRFGNEKPISQTYYTINFISLDYLELMEW